MKTLSAGWLWRGFVTISMVCGLLVSSGCERVCTTNSDCGDLEYCAKQQGACEATGICVNRPEACLMVLDPVCGCDNESHDNACLAFSSGVNVLSDGSCDEVLCAPEACGPVPGMPNMLCEDGSTGGPTGRCLQAENGMCAWEIRECPSDPVCGGEGETVSVVYDAYPDQCCQGLTEWPSGMDTRISIADACHETGLLAGAPVGTCLNCGNGICEEIENVCNCPVDCPDGAHSDYPTVEAFCAETWSPDMAELCRQGLPPTQGYAYQRLICELCAGR